MQYNYENIKDFYDEVVRRYVIEPNPSEKEKNMLQGLLEAKSPEDFSKWVTAYPKSDTSKPTGVEILHDKLMDIMPSELENFSKRLTAEQLAMEMQEYGSLDEGQLADSQISNLYSSIMSNSIVNVTKLNNSEKSIYRQLDNAETVADLQKWASDVRYGNVLQYSDETPYEIQENVRELAQLIYDADDDGLQFMLDEIQETRYSDKLNTIRMSQLQKKFDDMKMVNPSDVVLFKNKDGFTIIGDDALKVMNLTGWPAGLVRDPISGNTMYMLNINNDGYEVLVNKDLNLRTTLSLGYLNILSNQWFNKTNYALQTIDYNLSLAEQANVNIPTENLNIGNFKAKSLNITEKTMNAISESGESLVIRDIPENFYHLEGTLVVADYINGNRKTIENLITNAQKSAVKEEPFLDKRARENIGTYKKVKSSNEKDIVAVEDNNIFFSYGADAEKLSNNSAVNLHKTSDGIVYVTASRSDLESILDNSTAGNIRLASADRDIEGNIIDVTRESIKTDANKIGSSSMVHKNDEGGYSVTEMLASGETNGPIELSPEDSREYERLRAEGTVKDRTDFVVNMTEKYCHQVIKNEETINENPEKKAGIEPDMITAPDMPEKVYYVSVNYLQNSEDTREFDKLEEQGKYAEMLQLASEYDNGDSLDQSQVWESPKQNVGDDVLDENRNYAIVYNNSVGGTYDILRRVTEQDIRDSITRYGLQSDASESVKKIAGHMAKEEFEKIKSMPAFTMDNGEILYFQYNEETNKIEVGGVTNVGLHPLHEFDYDHECSLDANLENVYEQLSEMEEYQAKEEEIEEVSFDNKEDLKDYITKYCEEHGWESDLNHIDVSKITDMSHLFSDVNSYFKGDISEWDVSNVENMAFMFAGSHFDDDLSGWNTSKVENMSHMFIDSKFNGDISEWDVSNVKDMSYMFKLSNFNQPLDKWNTSKVEDMSYMFNGAQFNQPIGNWDVSNVKNMSKMFLDSLFKQDISNLLLQAENTSHMLDGSLLEGTELKSKDNPKAAAPYSIPEGTEQGMANEPTPLEGYGKYWNFVSAKILALDLAGYEISPEVKELAVRYLKGETLTDAERERIEKENEVHADAIEKDGKRNYVDITARTLRDQAGPNFNAPTPKRSPIPEYTNNEPAPQKTVNPVDLKGTSYHAYLLDKYLKEASENNGVWLNKYKMSAPTFALSKNPIPAYNQMIMSLNATDKNYATNVYLTFDDAKSMDLFLRKGEKAVGLVNYNSRQYVNSFRAAEVITQDQYDKLPKEERSLYKPANRQKGMKELVSMFNIDQTTAAESAAEKYKEMVASAHREEQIVPKDPAQLLETFKKLSTERPDEAIFMNAGNFYETYDDTAEKVSSILNLSVTNDESRNCKVVSFPVSKSPEMVALLNDSKCKVSLYDSSVINNRPLIDYREEAMDFIKKTAESMGVNIDKITYMPTSYDEKNDSIHIKTNNLSMNSEQSSNIKDINDMYRALIDSTDKSDRLDRRARLDLKPEDAKKYNALITELASGVLMLRQGLPARISEENMELIPYWRRELKENPKIMETIERNVDSAYKAIMRHYEGQNVNYSEIRDSKEAQFMQPKFYSIVNELASLPKAETRHAVIVRDKNTSTATVILPAGASVDTDNEIQGMNKNRYRVALKKEGYENINFYNADGYLSLNQPNNFFVGKEVSVEKLRQYTLEKFMDVDVKAEIKRTQTPEILNNRYIKNDEGRFEIYIKPADGKAITVLPMPDILDDYLRTFNMDDKSAAQDKRKDIAQKLLDIAQRYPEAITDTLYPKTDGVDLSKIQSANITKSEDSGKYLIFMESEGKKHCKEITESQYKRLFLVDDMKEYKVALAGKLFAQELGHEVLNAQAQEKSEQQKEAKPESDDIDRGNSKNVNRADTDDNSVNTPDESVETQSESEVNEEDENKQVRRGGRGR